MVFYYLLFCVLRLFYCFAGYLYPFLFRVPELPDSAPKTYSFLPLSSFYDCRNCCLLLQELKNPAAYYNGVTIYYMQIIIFSISSCFVFGNTCAYKSIVIAKLLCPKMLLSVCGVPPCSINLVANVSLNA